MAWHGIRRVRTSTRTAIAGSDQRIVALAFGSDLRVASAAAWRHHSQRREGIARQAPTKGSIIAAVVLSATERRERCPTPAPPTAPIACSAIARSKTTRGMPVRDYLRIGVIGRN